MAKYLYGASVQGIQGFIFKTNKLQEIVGASEIVKSIEDEFRSSVKEFSVKIIMNAAGNIKAIFDNKDECQKVLLDFAKNIQEKAYGITISQAVVKIANSDETQEDIDALEKKLKIQRNKPSISLDPSLNIVELNPSTAKPVVGYMKNHGKATPVDRAIKQKIDANKRFFEKNTHLKEFKNISSFSNGKNKIAVIYADGNGLGMLLPTLREKGMKLSEFSEALDAATKEAFEKAKNDDMDIRDVVLGGDDMIVICNANDALEFTKNFLRYFEEATEKGKLGYKLTACAGIAYCNEKYPFHYAVSLAEKLCDETKKHAKKINEELAPSSLMFHNIQSASYQSWKAYVEDELTIVTDNSTVRCDFGPYYIDAPNEVKIDDFMHTLEAYRCEGSPISRLRAWIGELHHSREYADRMLERINEMADKSDNWKSCIMAKNLKNFKETLSNETLIVKKDGIDKTPIYDVLQILSATEAK